jgi:hypothetical protein
MFKIDKSVTITASNNAGKLLHINYKFLDTSLANRWISVVKENQKLNNNLQINYRKILNPEEKLENFNIFRDNVLKINSMYDKELTDIITLEYLYTNQHILNDLHKEFEIYGDRLEYLKEIGYFNKPEDHLNFYNPVWPGKKQNFDLHDRFLRLNEQIHNFETIFRNWGDPEGGQCSCLVDYIPTGIHEPLNPEDYFLFESNLNWGWLYLGYNTLGKHWLSSCLEHDNHVVARDQIRPQARFAAECYMYFGRPMLPYSNRAKFYNWWQENKFSKIRNPDMKLSEFALGYIPLGRIFNYRFNNEEWQSIPLEYTHVEAKEWNSSVWSKFNTIVNLEIINQ